MIDLTLREAAALVIMQNEIIGTEKGAEALVHIAARNDLPPDFAVRMAEAYTAAMEKLVIFMRSSVDTRSLLKVINGGKQDAPAPREGA